MEQFQTVKYTSLQYHRKFGKRQAEKNSKKSTPRHIIFKLEKKETLKETKRKDTLLQEREEIQIISDFFSESRKKRMERNIESAERKTPPT